jgi:ABC-type uncharacterized transport system involved in gliding motility auxiliary subunit
MTKANGSRVLTVLGVVLLVSTGVSFVLFESRLLALVKLALAVAAVAGGVALSERGGLRHFFTGRALHFGFFTAISAVLLVGLLAVANWAAYRRPVSLDLTRNRIWSLSDDTVRLVGKLDRDVDVLAFYGPADEDYRAARALLDQYAARSPRFRARLVDPVAAPELLRQHGVTAGQPRLVLSAGGRTEKAAAPTEEELTNALVRLTRAGVRKVYFTEGHGEPPLRGEAADGLSSAVAALEGQGYAVAAAALLRDGEVPPDAAALLVVGPRKPLLAGEVAAVRRYLARGGRLAVLAEPETSSGLEPVLAEAGMELDDDLVLDPSPAAQAMGGNASTPVVQPAREHPVTRALAEAQLSLLLETARSLSALTGPGGERPAHPLLLTSATAWGETDLAGLRDPARGAQRGDGEKGGPMPVALAAALPAPAGEGKLRARVVAVGDADFVANRLAGALGNREFFLNAVGWLTEQEDRITIRARARDAAVVFLDQGQALTLAVVSVDVVPVLLLGIGLAIWLVRRSR